MVMEIRQLQPFFAGEVSGMDLAQPLDAAAVRTLWEAIDRYAVLIFHEQRLSDEQLRDFARNFGELEIGRSAAEGGRRRLSLPEIGDISNLDEEGTGGPDPALRPEPARDLPRICLQPHLAGR
jgi:alpha-ketoglutarate-dependent 2,4-dichlorophenoxyacetate dioxygenase